MVLYAYLTIGYLGFSGYYHKYNMQLLLNLVWLLATQAHDMICPKLSNNHHVTIKLYAKYSIYNSSSHGTYPIVLIHPPVAN